MYRYLLLILVFLSFQKLNASNDANKNLEQYFKLLDKKKFYDCFDLAKIISNENLKTLTEILFHDGQDKSGKYFINKLNKNNGTDQDKAILILIKGYIQFYYNDKKPNSFDYFHQAYTIAIKTENDSLIKFCLESILKVYEDSILINNSNYNKYLIHYSKLSKTDFEKLKFYLTSHKLSNITKRYNDKTHYLNEGFVKKIDQLNHSIKESNFYYYKYLYAKASDLMVSGKLNEAKQIFKSFLNFKTPSPYFKKLIFNALVKLAAIEINDNDFNQSLFYLKYSENFLNSINSKKDSFALMAYKAEAYGGSKKYDSAFKFIKLSRYLEYDLNFLKSYELITATEIENQTQQEVIKNLELTQENSYKNKWLIVFSILILFGTFISYLQLKNSRRKRLLALQQKELETQKNLTLLKEQEITSIIAMVEGQEKERKRVAEDLHDNLGSVIATLKLHFENLKINREKKKINQDVLFDKTETLIDEAYLKVRSIAHAKNAGVIANQGLLVAVQMMAEKISSANSLQIEVVHFGLEKTIENSLEISLFRIIQELVTNVIKHAEASEATINISQHENNINIIIEDNGKGIDVSQMNIKKGMGIHSIKTRVNHLQGTFTIDSTPTKGTSILIDVPI